MFNIKLTNIHFSSFFKLHRLLASNGEILDVTDNFTTIIGKVDKHVLTQLLAYFIEGWFDADLSYTSNAQG